MRKGYWTFIVYVGFLFLAFLSGCAWSGSAAPTLALVPTIVQAEASIGTVTRLEYTVEQGPEKNQLAPVVGTSMLNAGDFIKVSGGGEGRIDFWNDLQLHVFNDTSLKTITIEHGENMPLMARIRLEMGGFTGQLTDPTGDGSFEIETPNGAKIHVTGTEFFVIYNSTDNVLGVGNFEGETSVAVEGTSLVVSPEHYVIIRPSQPIASERPIPLAQAEMEAAFRQQKSAVKVLQTVLEPTATPSPMGTITPTPTLTATPTQDCPPTLEVMQNVNCREGPGITWKRITTFNQGIRLEPKGFATFDNSKWWNVLIPSTVRSCWILSDTVNVIGETGCMMEYRVPATYTPIVTNTSTPQPAAPELISPANGEAITCVWGGPTYVSLHWSTINGAASYEWSIEYPGDSGRSPQTGTTTDGTASVEVDCPSSLPSDFHNWRVRAFDEAGNPWPYSAAWSFQTFGASPPSITTTP